MNTRAKDAILGRLRAATVTMGLPRPSAPVRLRRSGTEPDGFAAFAAALTALGPTFERAATPEAAREALVRAAIRHEVKTAVRWDHPDLAAVGAAEALAGAGVAVLAPADLPDRVCPSLAAVDMGLTGVEQALCATGSLILAAGPGRERATPLVPRLHVALLARSRLLPDLPALCDRLAAKPMPSAVNCVTGVSSTGDIEFVYVRGVHGPLAVHVIGCDWL
ncbi:Lactate utilization protein B/C [Solidesulfovibrio carbinoliphilus subsp. oakridgensis]|uniref:Lactate utilization protein B/C n=1 Tax=Solidesulfovibrio carbinoliphilus subsp. oakridgensis TaxID=694327 RepID=G7QDW6_9BACT|nr:LUD domain-containing protein [Solidesulfovibrio carbinoliphilus]EHJ46622.1 Lactate utilization protein B/C [Solidesulfovibrio carbinoliphilus subsp. oakridgensis]